MDGRVVGRAIGESRLMGKRQGTEMVSRGSCGWGSERRGVVSSRPGLVVRMASGLGVSLVALAAAFGPVSGRGIGRRGQGN